MREFKGMMEYGFTELDKKSTDIERRLYEQEIRNKDEAIVRLLHQHTSDIQDLKNNKNNL
jgi:hypothetical protein